MHKLTIAAVVAGLCVSAFADDSIASANVVGYKTGSDFKVGSQLYTPSFAAVGGGEYSVNDLVPGNFAGYEGGQINFESLDAYGRSVEGSFHRYLKYEGYFDGWYDADTVKATKTFKPGEAVWLEMPGVKDAASEVTLTDAGQVCADDVVITLATGSNAIGNMMATDYPIADIEVGNYGSYTGGQINFESLDAYGRSIEGSFYRYLVYEGYFNGWYDADTKPATASLKPGQSVWFESPADGVTLTFSAPDL